MVVGTEGEHALDISQLRARTGYITLDEGYGNTGSCRSAITFIDGEQGILRYRGIPIQELAEKSHFIETAYLLIWGHLPNQQQLDSFRSLHTKHQLLLLHADHEQNCSTSTVRMIGSSGANLFASVAGGVSALWGPLHGGANLAVVEMLEEIIEARVSVGDFIGQVKDRRNNIRLMGFGHRVYKSFDPWARMMRAECEAVLAKLGRQDPLLEVAEELEAAALEDEYFVERKLYPNVDFYSGVILRAIRVPKTMFPVIFAIGRMPGWIAQWYEDRFITKGPIHRPRQVYTGLTEQTYVPMDQRP